MIRFLRRLMCKTGHHEWYSVQFVWGGWDECGRCGKRFPE